MTRTIIFFLESAGFFWFFCLCDKLLVRNNLREGRLFLTHIIGSFTPWLIASVVPGPR
jgi:hypothetical protein